MDNTKCCYLVSCNSLLRNILTVIENFILVIFIRIMGDFTEPLVILSVVFVFFVLRYIVQGWYTAYRRKLEERDRLEVESRPNIVHVVHQPITWSDTPPPEFESALKYSIPVSYIQIDETPPPSYAEYRKSISKDSPNSHASVLPVDLHDNLNPGTSSGIESHLCKQTETKSATTVVIN